MQGREWKDNSKGMDSAGSKLDRGEFAEESQRYPLSKRIPAHSSRSIRICTMYWIKIVIGNKEEFMNYMFKKGYFNSFSIICLNKKVIYDIELGESEYEIRICNY